MTSKDKMTPYGHKNFYTDKAERLENLMNIVFSNPTTENILEMMYACGTSMRQGVSIDVYFPYIAKNVFDNIKK